MRSQKWNCTKEKQQEQYLSQGMTPRGFVCIDGMLQRFHSFTQTTSTCGQEKCLKS